jgi:3-hydroxyacyl-CoA dehydrogenase
MNCTHDEGRGTLMTIGINPTQRNRQGHAFGHWPDKVDNNDRFFCKPFYLPTSETDTLTGFAAHGNAPSIAKVGVIGANATSIGIAMGLLETDVPVTLFEFKRDALDSGLARAYAGYRSAVTEGRLTPDRRDRCMGLLAGTVNFHHLKDCDLIIDAKRTSAADKETLFRRLDQVAKPGAVLMTEASDVSVDQIAGWTRRLGNVLGFHVASSGNTDKTWTLVPGQDTTNESVNIVMALARRLHNVAIVCDLCHGITIDAKNAIPAGWCRFVEDRTGV